MVVNDIFTLHGLRIAKESISVSLQIVVIPRVYKSPSVQKKTNMSVLFDSPYAFGDQICSTQARPSHAWRLETTANRLDEKSSIMTHAIL